MLPLMFLFLLSIFFCANSAGLRNDGKYQKDRASAAENQFGAPTHSSHPLRCEQGRSQSGFWWISGHYHPGYNGSECKMSLYTPKLTTPSVDTSEMRMTKDVGNGSICLERIQIQNGSKDLSNLKGLFIELTIEGNESPEGWWPILFEQTQTEFLFTQSGLTSSNWLDNPIFCLDLPNFNLTVHSKSQLVEAMIWMSELPIDFWSDRLPHQARWVIGNMADTSSRCEESSISEPEVPDKPRSAWNWIVLALTFALILTAALLYDFYRRRRTQNEVNRMTATRNPVLVSTELMPMST
ncbi:uncharacterized protein LOC134851293 [Symsagittifera roscoffensis]|uniref:uncharacterized protein LOC134851293 n=1 Tax=Symsagittifera roscoffensis TaxID=84072 RepID=UPI00307C3A0C